MPHILRLPVLTSEAKKVVTKEQQRTYQDFPLRGHHFAAESQQAVQVAKVFDLSDEGKTLLEFPFPATRIALCNLWSEGKSEIFTLSCCSLICKIYSPKCIQFIFPFLRGRTAWCTWICSLQSRIPQWSLRTAPSPGSGTWTGRRRRTDSGSPTFLLALAGRAACSLTEEQAALASV